MRSKLNLNLFQVSGKMDSQKVPACLHELSVLFAALKDNEFNEKNCVKEIEALRKANIEALNKAREEKLRNTGDVTSTGYKLSSTQLNKYFKKFPQKD